MKTGRKNKSLVIVILFICWFSFPEITSAQSYDLEYIYTKNSTDQEYPTLDINLIANLYEYDISQIARIRIEAVNEFEGTIDNISLIVEPKNGYHIKDPVTASIIDQYLIQEFDLDKASEMIMIQSMETDTEIHSRLFVNEQKKQVKIKLPSYPSKEVSFDYTVFVEMNSGESTKLKINKIDTRVK